jgi:uncharacterized coiled-coil protein SlyX
VLEITATALFIPERNFHPMIPLETVDSTLRETLTGLNQEIAELEVALDRLREQHETACRKRDSVTTALGTNA